MITEGEFEKGGKKYNRKLELSDWRYSAAALGMDKFFESMDIDRYKEKRAIYYNIEDIAYDEETNDSKYLMFVEKYFPEMMHHKVIEDLILKSELSDNEIKIINEKLSANTIMKKIFKSIKYSSENKCQIKKLIDENRFELICETFKNSMSGYRKFINTSKFRGEKGSVCRLLGFYVDNGRKLKSLGFGFDKEARTTNDEIEFDYIPFAFSRERESVFINNNFSLPDLMRSNIELSKFIDVKKEDGVSWNAFLYNYIEGSNYLDCDVEIIKKPIDKKQKKDKEQFESIFLRKQSIDIFKELSKEVQIDEKLKPLDILLNRMFSITEKDYINIMEKVTEAIINLLELDSLIDKILIMSQQESYIKRTNRKDESYIINNLIRVNVSIYKSLKRLEKDMDKNKYLGMAAMSAKSVVEYFKKNTAENKIKSYRQKLTSAIVARDYDRFIEIMLQLSSYTQMAFPFLHKLISDFEVNKNLAYAFVNRLLDNNIDKEMKGDINSEK